METAPRTKARDGRRGDTLETCPTGKRNNPLPPTSQRSNLKKKTEQNLAGDTQIKRQLKPQPRADTIGISPNAKGEGSKPRNRIKEEEMIQYTLGKTGIHHIALTATAAKEGLTSKQETPLSQLWHSRNTTPASVVNRESLPSKCKPSNPSSSMPKPIKAPRAKCSTHQLLRFRNSCSLLRKRLS